MRSGALGLLLGALLTLGDSPVALGAPRCLRDSCAERLLKRAARCFDPQGLCVRDDTAGVTCWANGARSTTMSFPDIGAERAIYTGPGGRRCQTVTSVQDPTGYQRTTHRRRGGKVVFLTSASGLRVTCPGGRVERYTTADLQSPACATTSPPVECDPGRCD